MTMFRRITVAVLMVAILSFPGLAFAQTSFIIAPSWIVSGGMNGSIGGVRASAIVGNDLILVGRFEYTRPSQRGWQTGFNRNAFLILDTATGSPSKRDFDPQVNGSIEAISCDGSDCVVAGGFTRFNGLSVNQIAKFNLLTGQVDEQFRSPLVFQGSYTTLLYRNGIVYAGGDFVSFEGPGHQLISRPYLAAFDMAGQLTSWNPRANAPVNRLRMSPTGTIFAAGYFTRVGEEEREGFAQITASGKITKFHPTASVGNSGTIGYDVAFYNNHIVLAGAFQVMAGNNHYGLAMVNRDGSDTGWNARTNFGFIAKTVTAAEDRLYVSFDSIDNQIGGQTRKRLAELSLSTGLATPFKADVEVDPFGDNNTGVRDIHVARDGLSGKFTRIFITGHYNSVAGVARSHVAKILGQ
jgi:hypothetical protein